MRAQSLRPSRAGVVVALAPGSSAMAHESGLGRSTCPSQAVQGQAKEARDLRRPGPGQAEAAEALARGAGGLHAPRAKGQRPAANGDAVTGVEAAQGRGRQGRQGPAGVDGGPCPCPCVRLFPWCCRKLRYVRASSHVAVRLGAGAGAACCCCWWVVARVARGAC